MRHAEGKTDEAKMAPCKDEHFPKDPGSKILLHFAHWTVFELWNYFIRVIIR